MNRLVERLRCLTPEKQRYIAGRLPEHLSRAEAYPRLFALFDDGQFLEAKAQVFGALKPLSDDVERLAIGAASAERDWPRFLHYSLLAANLRGLAEALAQEEIAKALAQNDRLAFALDIIDQVGAPLRRAHLRAVVISRLSNGRLTFHEQWSQLLQDLQDAISYPGEAESGDWLDTLTSIIRLLGPSVLKSLSPFLVRLPPSPDEQDQFWLAVAKAHGSDHETSSDEFWDALARIKNPNTLAPRISTLVRASDVESFWRTVDQLSCIGHATGLVFWHAVLSMLSSIARKSIDDAWLLWQQITSKRHIPWSPELVEEGRFFFSKLDSSALYHLCEGADNPIIETALILVALEESGEMPDVGSVLALIDRIPIWAKQIHWTLRLIAAGSTLPAVQQKRLLGLVTRELLRAGFCLSPQDACLYLDLIARIEPARLARQTDLVMCAASARPESLLGIATRGMSDPLVLHILDNVDKYASMVTQEEAEAFRLRRELLIEIAARLCTEQASLQHYERVKETLLPEEQDDLRVVVSTRLAADGLWDLAMHVCTEIESNKTRLVTRLRIVPPAEGQLPGASQLGELLDFGSLYASVADVSVLEDERLAVSALLESPHAPQELVLQYLAPMVDSERRAYALVDLARHALAYQELAQRDPAQRDYDSVAQLLRQAAQEVGSETLLLAITPELVEVAARCNGQLSVAEFSGAVERILVSDTIPWKQRWEALLTLLGNAEAVLFHDSGQTWDEKRLKCKELAAFVDVFLKMPDDPDLGQVKDELRQHWHELLPVMVATLEKMPPLLWDYIEHPARARACDEWPIIQSLNRSRAWNLLARAEQMLLPSSIRGRLQRERLPIRQWEWLLPPQKRIAELCLVDPDERSLEISRVLFEESLEPEDLQGLAYLVAGKNDWLLPGLVERLPSGPTRDRLCSHLVGDGWLDKWTADFVSEQLIGSIEDEALRIKATAAWSLRSKETREPEELESVSTLITGAMSERFDAEMRPLLRALWRADGGVPLEPIAVTVPDRLAAGGQHAGNSALRLWLNLFLRPSLGERSIERLGESSILQQAINRALRLIETEQSDVGEAGRVSPAGTRDRLTQVYRRWKSGQRKLDWGFVDSVGEGIVGNGIMLAMVFSIFLLQLDNTLFPVGEGTNDAGTPDAVLVAVVLSCFLIFFLINGWVVDTYLALATEDQKAYKGWLLRLRFVLSGLPMVSWYAITMWQWILQEQPAWAMKPHGQVVRVRLHGKQQGVGLITYRLTQCRAKLTWAARRFWSRIGILWAPLASFVIVYASLLLLPSGQALDPGSRIGVTIAVAILHPLVFCGVFAGFFVAARQRRVTGLAFAWQVGLAFFWLVPYPGSAFLGLILWTVTSNLSEPKHEKALVHKAYEGRSSLARVPSWLNLEDTLRRQWAASQWWRRLFRRPQDLNQHASETGDHQQRLMRTYRLKAFSLVVEAGALAYGIRWLAESLPVFSPVAEGILIVVVYGSLLLAAISLLVLTGQFVIGILRSATSLPHPSYATYLLMTQCALAVGTIAGYSWWEGDYQTAVGAVFTLALGALLLPMIPMFLGIFRTVPEEDAEIGLEQLLLIMLAMVLFSIIVNLGSTDPEQRLLADATLKMGPMVWALTSLSGILWFRSFLKPFRFSYAFEQSLPSGMRRTIAFMAASVILPLGGLAAPLWLYIHNRQWPRYTEFLATQDAESSASNHA